MSEMKYYSVAQKLTAKIIYIAFVITGIMIAGSTVWMISDFIMRRGKTDLFLQLSIGFQIAIIGSVLAILFFLLIIAYGFFKKGFSAKNGWPAIHSLHPSVPSIL